jgi:hypothetical protein
MNHESVRFIAGNTFSKLLQRPIGGRVPRDIEMREPSRMDFHGEEDIHQLGCRRRHNEEITRNDASGVISRRSSSVASGLQDAGAS